MRSFFEGMKAAQLQQLEEVGFWSLRFGDRRATWSSSQWRIFGRARDLPPFDREEFLARVHPEDRDSCGRFLDWQQMRVGETRSLVFRFDVPERGERWIAGHYELIPSGLGVAFGVQGLNRDVTDEVSNWYETLASRVVLRGVPSGIALVSREGEILYVNDSVCRILHRNRSELLGGRLPFDVAPTKESGGSEGPMQAVEPGDPSLARTRHVVDLPDGARRHMEVALTDLNHDGQDGVVVVVVDVTDRVDIEGRLAASEAQLRGAFESSAIGMAISDAQGRIVQANAKLAEILGVTMREMIGKDWGEINDPSEAPTICRLMDQLQRGERDHYSRVGRLAARAGRSVTAEIVCAAIRASDGKPSHYITQVSDVTDRLAIEKRLQEMVRRFRLVTETIDDVFWIADRALQQGIYVSPGFEKIWGIESRVFYSDPKIFMDAIHPDDRAGVMRMVDRQHSCTPFSHEYRIVRPDGEVRWILDKGFPVVDSDGEVRIYVGVARDITADKRLRESVDQAQRLEAIGQLTGELAHDFNNLLSIVMMNAVQAQRRVGTDDKLRRQLDTIVATTTRGGQVTKALLAVSSRQNLRPETCSIDGLIESARGLIETSAGPTTELRIHGSVGQAVAEIDPGAFSTALLNLVINARDSMQAGGVLTITVTVEDLAHSDPDLAAAKLPTGSYVVVEVADTGVGMTPDVLARVWEPFFTTK